MEIRVLTVRPASERSEPISCSLQTISIAEGRGANHYHALSYYWGSTAKDDIEEVVVYADSHEQRYQEGFKVPVTKQLTSALRQFRSRMPVLSHALVLWTDAICINQLDAEERSQQVTIMRHVYASATDTWVWLGDSDPAAEQGLANVFGLARLQQDDPYFENETCRNPAEETFDDTDYDVNVDLPFLEEANAYIKQWRRRDYSKAVEEAVKEVNEAQARQEIAAQLVPSLPAALTDFYHTIGALCSVPYWSRGWVLQEACANEDVVLHYGQTRCRVVDWLDFVEFSENNFHITDSPFFKKLYPNAGLDEANLVIRYFTDWLGTVQSTMAEFRGATLSNDGSKATMCFRRSMQCHVARDLCALFHSARRQTTDPRDQVYAILGYKPGFMQLGVKPNYNADTEEVFIRTTVEVLQAVQSWAEAPFINPSASPFLPSWTIDFTLPTVTKDNPLFLDDFRADHFSAACDAKFRLKEVKEGVILSAGFVYDKVVAVLPGPIPLSSASANRERETYLLVSRWWDNLNSEQHMKYISRNPAHVHNTDVWASFCRTLGLGAKDKEAAACRPWMLDNVLDRAFEGSRTFELLLFNTHLGSAKLVVTRNGHIGLVPLAVEPGDCIAILAAGNVPFAIRKVRTKDMHGDAYRLLGGCYIDGQLS